MRNVTYKDVAEDRNKHQQGPRDNWNAVPPRGQQTTNNKKIVSCGSAKISGNCMRSDWRPAPGQPSSEQVRRAPQSIFVGFDSFVATLVTRTVVHKLTTGSHRSQ
jgi:hypothetical protein